MCVWLCNDIPALFVFGDDRRTPYFPRTLAMSFIMLVRYFSSMNCTRQDFKPIKTSCIGTFLKPLKSISKFIEIEIKKDAEIITCISSYSRMSLSLQRFKWMVDGVLREFSLPEIVKFHCMCVIECWIQI